MTFGQKLAMYRLQTGLPQTLLAAAMGVSVPTFRATESGNRRALQAEIDGLARFSMLPVLLLQDDASDLPVDLPIVQVDLTHRGRPVRQVTVNTDARNRQIAARIRALIEARFDGSARQLAGAIHMDEAMLSGYLSGKRELTEKVLLRICRAVDGLSIDWLRTGIGTMDAPFPPVQAPACHDGQRLMDYMDRHGLYWADLQRGMGLKSLTSAVEYKNRTNIRHDTRARIAQALRVSVTDIFGC